MGADNRRRTFLATLVPLRTETRVRALGVFESSWAHHGEGMFFAPLVFFSFLHLANQSGTKKKNFVLAGVMGVATHGDSQQTNSIDNSRHKESIYDSPRLEAYVVPRTK